jgi:hypothetical protein
MSRKIVAAVALLATSATADYTNATMPWNKDLDCTACIRSGYDFCLSGPNTTLAAEYTCNFHPTFPEYQLPGQGINNGYVCSYALRDEINAIVNGCRPYIADAAHRGLCGDYWVDLTTESF